MYNQAATINRNTVAFQLNEAIEAIESTLGDIAEDTDPAIWVCLADILGHLCLAWHRKQIGPDEVMKESQEEFELKKVSVPNWGMHFQLVEITASHPAIDPRLSRPKINQDTIYAYLHAAEETLQNLMGKIESDQLNSSNLSLFGNEFEPILHNLCLAWHLKYLSGEEISLLDPTAVNELGWWLPTWQWNLHLIPMDSNANCE
jgi:hypothetical protein